MLLTSLIDDWFYTPVYPLSYGVSNQLMFFGKEFIHTKVVGMVILNSCHIPEFKIKLFRSKILKISRIEVINQKRLS